MASPLAGLAFTMTGSYTAAIIPAGALLAFACAALFYVNPSPPASNETSEPSQSAPVAHAETGDDAASLPDRHVSNTMLVADNPLFGFGGLTDDAEREPPVKQMV